MVSGGYPESYEKGKVISGLNKASDALVFHAGTKLREKDTLTDGGRVLAITGLGQTMDEARSKAYDTISTIQWENLYFRRDIGEDLKDGPLRPNKIKI